MILKIVRDQSKALLGGINFELKAQVELTSEEAELIKKYKAHKEVLLSKEVSLLGNKFNIDIKIADLVDGQAFKCKDIAQILETEDNVKEACKSMKNYIMVMKSFGGQETYEF
ncbi:MAG: hypothetical protein LHW64_08515 [Candidatus Cloacimonetes bacterium]|jgi:hypothetical protein|nr:hypothetical protein [Candidatus Cloacimonadota bacterium]MCB5287836.1 hypothetical protein [Candidatus Cloacimonadota bacterium]MDD2229954.1 hypothetical protein [Candidatus Cloacimonadota bacterium]MDY0230157.1 hypothetical protein [Candidatus Cloacimonadaceae bacterium]